MVIMALSYTQATGDTSLISNYVSSQVVLPLPPPNGWYIQFTLLDQWTQFLVNDSLIPENQISTDDFAGPLANQTNLAIKGIIGIQAMSIISGLLGNTQEEANYSVSVISMNTLAQRNSH